MAVSQHDIEKYLRGELSHAERHALEKEALRDPFLADALSGAEQISPEAFGQDLAMLEHRIQLKAEKKKRPILRIAAGVALAFGLATGAYFYFLPANDPAPLALQHEQTEAIGGNETEKTVFADSTQQQAVAKQPISPVHQQQSDQSNAAGTKSPESEPLAIADVGESPKKTEEQTTVVEKSVESEPVAPVAKQPATAVLGQEAKRAVAREETDRELQRARKPAAASQFAAQGITGQVVSAEDGSPLPGVNVVLKGTTTGTVTDVDGRFQLPSVAGGVLVFSFIGLQSVEQQVATTPLVVKMPMDVSSLSEVVVTGYGFSDGKDLELGLYRVAEPVGGRKAFNQYLSESLVYPLAARAKKIEGKVTVQFKVQQNGQLTDFLVIKGIGGGCEEELMRLIKEGPAWTAELSKGRPVVATVRVRFNFRLSDN